jgi:hypothetical protein
MFKKFSHSSAGLPQEDISKYSPTNASLVPPTPIATSESLDYNSWMSLPEQRRHDIRNAHQVNDEKTTKLGIVKTASKPITKTAQVQGIGAAGYRGTNDVSRAAPDIYSPLWLTSNMSLPRDRATINAWCRAFYALNPIVHNAINLHSFYPISSLNIKCKDKKVERFFSEMNEELNLTEVCIKIAQDFWLLGEAFPWAELNEATLKWSRIKLMNPDYIDVIPGYAENHIVMRPDETIKKIINSNRPQDQALRQQIPTAFAESIKRYNMVPLDDTRVSHIARTTNSTDHRGTGLPVSVFRQLMLIDLARECDFAQFQDMVNPWRIIKIGNGDDKPTAEDLEAYRAIFEQALYDKNYKIFTHDAVAVETVGAGGGIYDTSAKITQLIKEVHIGLLTPSVVVEGGGDISYANGTVALDVLRQRYIAFRSKIQSWLVNKIFKPIAVLQGFYENVDRERRLIVPTVEWNYMNLFDNEKYIDTLKDLAKGEGDKKMASQHTLFRSLGLDYEDEMSNIQKEMRWEAVLKKEKENLEKMSLAEIRNLSEDEEVPEVQDGGGDGGGAEPPVPGEPGADAGAGDAGGLPGLEPPQV